MDNNDLAGVLQRELDDADDSALQANYIQALNYYNADPAVNGTVATGWSDLVSTDVRDAIESAVCEIMGAIGDEPLAWFAPMTEQDIDQAESESWLVQHAIMSQNRGALVIEECVRDALLMRIGIAKIWMDERKKTISKSYKNIDPATIPTLLQANPPSTGEIIEFDEHDGLVDITIRYDLIARDLKLQSIPPEDFRWSREGSSCWLNDRRFLAERAYYTRAQLITLGVPAEIADSVNANTGDTGAAFARRGTTPTQSQAARSADELIECWWCWLRNEDESRLRVLFASPSTILLQPEDMPFHPYAAGVTTIQPHRIEGLSLFDRQKQIQDAKTTLMRQLATNAKWATRGRIAMRSRGANPADIMSDKLMPVIETNGDPSTALLPLPVQDVTSQLLSTLQWLDKSRRDMGGAAIDMASPEMQVGQQSAHAAEREYSFRELQSEQILRTIGQTLIRSIYLLAHATLREYSPGTITAQQRKTWIAQDPQQWPYRSRCVIELGQSLGTKSRRLAALGNLISNQMQVFSGGGGGIMCTLDNLYQAQIQWARTAGIQQAEQYWQDPASQEAQQSAQRQAQQAQAQAQAQQQAQQQIVQVERERTQIDATLEAQKNRITEINNRMVLQEKYFADLIDLITKHGNANEAQNTTTPSTHQIADIALSNTNTGD